MNLPESTTLQNGKYRIIRVLGQGGFGITYLAEHTMLGKKVAIKEFFPKQYCDRDESTSHVTIGTSSNVELIGKLKRRFLKEARNIANLDHPGIVKIQDVFEENDTAYYVMDYIEGRSLQQIVRDKGALPQAKAIEYILQVGEALEYIHSRKMSHYDVKPANIMVRQSDDKPVLIDFGLSMQYTQEGDATTTGLSGLSRGYSAIELAFPDRLSTFSEQSDVYSLGATLFFLLTGTVPPDSSELSSGLEELNIPNSVDTTISKAISNAMEINRTRRCQNVHSFLSALTEKIKPDSGQGPLGSTSTPKDNNDTENGNDDTVILPDYKGDAPDDNPIEEEATASPGEQEYNPTRWDRFLNYICGTAQLRNGILIPNSRKVSYMLTFIILCILALPGGWIFLFFLYSKIKYSLQRLFFADYLDEWDYAYDYSKGTAIWYTVLPVLISTCIFLIIFISNRQDHETQVTRYVESVATPSKFGDVTLDSVSFSDKEIIYYCQSNDSIHSDRDSLNHLSTQVFLHSIADKDSKEYELSSHHDLKFKFFNGEKTLKDYTIKRKDIENVLNMSPEERAEQYLSYFIQLFNKWTPITYEDGTYLTGMDIKQLDGVLIGGVSDKEAENLGSNQITGKYLIFYFENLYRSVIDELQSNNKSRIMGYLPLDYGIANSVINALDGICIIYDNSELYKVVTSDELRQMLDQQSRNFENK